MARACRTVAFLSDFGSRDAFVGIVKGVVLSRCADLSIIDICHEVLPQNVEQGAYLLGTCSGYFPPGTVFLAVVDPGVGGQRRALAVAGRDYFYVGPDNGLFSRLWARDEIQLAIEIQPSQYTLAGVSATFHGRDLYAPVAAHLAAGLDIRELGQPCTDLVRLPSVARDWREASNELQVIHVDTFGNLITDLSRQDDNPPLLGVQVGGTLIPLVRTYGDVPAGEPLAYWGSSGYLEVGVNCGSAAGRFELAIGARLQVRLA